MANNTTTNSMEQPYKPSWIDRFTNWVETLPIQAWVFYVGLGFVLILSQVLFLWLEGGLQAEVLLPIIIFNGLATPFLLALIQLFDNQAVTALNSMSPTLEMTEPEFDQCQYKLANMPVGLPLIAGVSLVVIAILLDRFAIAPIRYAALEQLPVFAVVFHILDKSSAFLFGVFIYHTIRQLRLVNTINLHHIRFSLFNLGPAQVFSKLTASTAVGLVIGMYVWMLLNPELLTNPISFGFAGSITILAVVVFVWPLWGIHRLLEVEKDRTLHDIDLRFEALFSRFNERIRDDDYSAIENLNWTISSLEIQHKRVKAIPTWPWRPDTARFALTAIALPLILTIIQYLVVQAFER
jgi:hypothetical protein